MFMKSWYCKSIGLVWALLVLGCDEGQSVEMGDDGSVMDQVVGVWLDDHEVGRTTPQALEARIHSVSIGGQDRAVLSIADIIQATNAVADAELDAFLAQYQCDYESGEDGFRPSSKGDRCPPVTCTEALRSYLDVTTENLIYADEAPMTTGCYQVSQLAKVILTSRPDASHADKAN